MWRRNRVDVAPPDKTSDDQPGEEPQSDNAEQSCVNSKQEASDEEEAPTCFHSFRSSTRAFFERLRHRRNLAKINQILAIVYIILGILLLIATLSVQPHNPMPRGRRLCWNGACFVQRATGWPEYPFHHHSGLPTSYHPYNWAPALAGIVLLIYATVILARPTIFLVNSGHWLNWVATFVYLYAVLTSFFHFDNPRDLVLTDALWLPGIVHSFFEPILLGIGTVLLLGQMIANLILVEFCLSLLFYSEAAQWAANAETEDDAESPSGAVV